MASLGLTELLMMTQDHATTAAAQQQIQNAEQASEDEYFKALAQELANTQKPMMARQLSGLLLKNGLYSKDPVKNNELKARWLGLPETTRTLVKEATTTALIAQERDVGKSAAQVLAKIGAIEVPQKRWDGLIPLLLQHVTNRDARARQIALITLGYLCEDLVAWQEESGSSVQAHCVNYILTAVVSGMQDSEPTTTLEAARAFYHAVVLAQNNFRNDAEREQIMQVVTNICRAQGTEEVHLDVQIAAFECLVQIATEYYNFLMPYMQALGILTLETIKQAPEKVAIPAMEFWSTICDEELYLADLAASGQPSERASLNLIRQALPMLVPLLTATMTRRGSDEDDDTMTWNLAMASGTCLGLVAQVVGDACVDCVLSFVQAHFENADWKYREAAVLAYGSIMEGPSSEKMRPLVANSYQPLVRAMEDQSVAVRDTIAWTLGRIAQFHPTIVPIKDLTPVLVEKLQDVPRVSCNICWVLQVLAEGQTAGATQAPETTPLSEFFPLLAERLLQVVARPDANERQLRMAAYNALSIVIIHAGNDCLTHMPTLVQELLNHLAKSFTNVDRECELQGYICGVLTAPVQRLRERIIPAADRVMEETLKVIAAYQQVKGGSRVLQEEALHLAAALANAVGGNFERFMPHFSNHLWVGLQNYEDVQVCLMATGVVGDLCRALEGKIISYVETIIQILYQNLQNPAVDRKIKAAIMVCFGDIALAIGGDFEKYLVPVVQMLQDASKLRLQDVQPQNEESQEYLNSLREGVLEAYSGIIHGLQAAEKLYLFKASVNVVLHFVEQIAQDSSTSEAVMKAAVGVVGDLVCVFKQELTQHLVNAPFLGRLVTYASQCTDPKMLKTASWLQDMLQRYGTAILVAQ